MTINEIEDFASKMQSLGDDYGVSPLSDWATDCPEYKVTAVEVEPANHRSVWQEANQKRQQNQIDLLPVS